MQKHRLLEQALPSLFPFSLPPPPPLFAPATQATSFYVRSNICPNPCKWGFRFAIDCRRREQRKLDLEEISWASQPHHF